MQRAGSGKDDSQQRTPSASQPQAISQLILGHAVQTGAASTQPTNTTLLAPLHSVPAPSPSVAAPMLAPSFTLTAPVPRGLAGVAPYYASATPTGVGILSKPPPNCFITASPTSITRARVQPGLTGGLVAVPPVGQTRKPQHPSPQSSSPRPVPHSLLVVQQVAAPELQMARPQAGGMASLAPLTSASATGGTIHHLGHSPPRGGMPPLANPTMVPHMSSGQPNPPFIQMSPGVLPRRDSTSATGSPSVPGLVSLQYPIIKSPVQSPERPRKKVKVEEKPPATPEIGTWRKVVQEQKIKELRELKENYNEHLTELFFLQNGGNIMDYYTWKKRPTVQLVQFLKSGNLDSDDEDIPQEKKINDEVKVLMTSGGTTPLATPIAISTTLPAAITAMQQQGIDQSRKPGGRHGMVFAHAPPQMSVSQAPASQPSTPVGTPTTGRPTVAQILKSASSSSSNVAASTTLHAHLTEATVTPTTAAQKTPVVSSAAGTVKTLKTPTSSQKSPRPGAGSALDSTIGSQEAIVERAKQEAQVMQRIAELRKNGMWSARRLPKVQEPPRNKAHWDYLLEEMQWLAADFAQERKWKKAGARKIARMISKHFQEQQQKELRAEKEEVMKLKRIASQMARQIKEFWQNIEKVVQFKQQSRLEEKKKRALDLHLSFIVDQTEKYSSWLTEGLGTRSTTSSVYSGSQATSPAPDADQEDGDFEPVKDESDDEETIEKEEQETDLNEESTRNEIDALQRESEMPIEELLQSLPPEVLEKPAPLDLPEEDDGQEAGDEDEEFRSSDEEAEDDEETLEEEEKQERTVDHSQEISELQQEGEMPMEELLQKYAGAYDSDFEAELSAQSTETEEDSDDIPTDYEDEEDEEADDEEEEIDVEGEDDVGMECLFDTEKQKKGDGSEPGHEITDIAAAAQSLQPTGYTLETTQVKTPVPFLLKHTLREYQHVGLDWLATMYDRRLNGILADEMGLGKTIQTIALLAHLACEKGVWGPHLIVVPTSVMLNWEMEIKKWCPAFKILTYYGTQKERKQKRQGWTKTNAFHVCITSYKLVIQDHQSFRRKKWKYFILDEAQNIKNFKSQRWQTLLNFSSQRRLLLTGTPLQNNLMELWSLMHFLMPHVFQSHREFKEWFSNPLSGMIEGSREYNESLIRRLHKVLRPFLLRRLKHDVEKQLPKKYEHVVMCRLSKRQRFLYDDFMSQAKTKETLATGHFMSVINILMQLRKVCNHPNLFDPRPTVSPFQMEGITYSTASAVLRALEKDPVEYIDPSSLYPCLADLELKLPAFAAHRIRKLQTPKPLIDEIDSTPEPPPRPEPLKKPLSVVFRNLSSALQSTELSNQQQTGRGSPLVETGRMSPAVLTKSSTPVPTSRSTASTPSTPQISTQQPKTPAASSIVTSAVLSRALSTPVQVTTPAPSAVTGTPIEQLPGYKPTIQSKLQVQQRAATVTQVTTTPVTATPVSSVAQQMISSQPITLHLQQTEQGTRLLIPSGQLAQLPAGLLSIVQTPGGQQIITTQPVSQSQAQVSRPIVNGPVPVSRPPITTTASSTAVVMTTTAATVQVAPSVSRTPQAVQLPTSAITVAPSKPVMRVAPLTTTTASASCQLSSALSTSAVGSSPLSSSHTSTASVHASTPTGHVTRSRTKLEKSLEPEKKSLFFLQSLEDKRRDWREECLRRLIYLNKRNCDIRPVYGQDLCGAVDILKQKMPSHHTGLWKGQGYIHCCKAQHPALFNPNLSHHYWTQTRGLVDMVHTPEELLASMKDILDRFQFVTPAVTAPRTCLHASHPPPEHLSHQRVLEYMLHKEVSPKAACLHRISTNMSVQFPELRLIQYDCGKLQTLDILLRRLKSGQHRVLIFTQMTKMLDVMEQFLSFHGYRYLRLDGTTRVEQRQALMDRFNMDKRIFVFILSTRSGGIGVNLTGADTVIFYDSDWNPTMDAQAQDRCHRIGQTRDVHIYRLISEKTIEENILKKANQKRLLGNVAIEGGNFTTAFFKEQTIQELFEEPSGLEALAKEKEREELAKQVKEIKEKPVSTRSKRRSPTPAEPGKLTEEQMELALCNAEDETDVQAARVARAEQKAELAEFDEDIPWDEREEQQRKEREEEMSKVEQELLMLEKELTPVERYAVCYMESVLEPECTEELELAEKEVEIAKEEWELGRLKALKEEEERRAAFEEDEMLFTYTRDDAYNQVKKKGGKQAKAARQSKGGKKPKLEDDDEEYKVTPKRSSSRASRGSIGSTQNTPQVTPKSRSSACSTPVSTSDKKPTRTGAATPQTSQGSGANTPQPVSKVVQESKPSKRTSQGKTLANQGNNAKVVLENGETEHVSPLVVSQESRPVAVTTSTPVTLKPSSRLASSQQSILTQLQAELTASQARHAVPQSLPQAPVVTPVVSTHVAVGTAVSQSSVRQVLAQAAVPVSRIQAGATVVNKSIIASQPAVKLITGRSQLASSTLKPVASMGQLNQEVLKVGTSIVAHNPVRTVTGVSQAGVRTVLSQGSQPGFVPVANILQGGQTLVRTIPAMTQPGQTIIKPVGAAVQSALRPVAGQLVTGQGGLRMVTGVTQGVVKTTTTTNPVLLKQLPQLNQSSLQQVLTQAPGTVKQVRGNASLESKLRTVAPQTNSVPAAIKGPISILIPGTGKTILINPASITSVTPIQNFVTQVSGQVVRGTTPVRQVPAVVPTPNTVRPTTIRTAPVATQQILTSQLTQGVVRTATRPSATANNNKPTVVGVASPVAATAKDGVAGVPPPWSNQNLVIRTRRASLFEKMGVVENSDVNILSRAAQPQLVPGQRLIVNSNKTVKLSSPSNTVPILEKMALQLNQGSASSVSDVDPSSNGKAKDAS